MRFVSGFFFFFWLHLYLGSEVPHLRLYFFSYIVLLYFFHNMYSILKKKKLHSSKFSDA